MAVLAVPGVELPPLRTKIEFSPGVVPQAPKLPQRLANQMLPLPSTAAPKVEVRAAPVLALVRTVWPPEGVTL